MPKLKTLSNTDISNICIQLNLPLKNVLMRGEIKDNLKDGFCFINLDISKNDGTHWTACLHYFYFFGFIPPFELEEHFGLSCRGILPVTAKKGARHKSKFCIILLVSSPCFSRCDYEFLFYLLNRFAHVISSRVPCRRGDRLINSR